MSTRKSSCSSLLGLTNVVFFVCFCRGYCSWEWLYESAPNVDWHLQSTMLHMVNCYGRGRSFSNFLEVSFSKGGGEGGTRKGHLANAGLQK